MAKRPLISILLEKTLTSFWWTWICLSWMASRYINIDTLLMNLLFTEFYCEICLFYWFYCLLSIFEYIYIYIGNEETPRDGRSLYYCGSVDMHKRRARRKGVHGSWAWWFWREAFDHSQAAFNPTEGQQKILNNY